MPFVIRDTNRKVTGTIAGPNPYSNEWLADSDPEVLAYRGLDLASQKREKHRVINQWRDAAIAAGVTHNNHVWDSNPQSILLLTATLAAFTAGVPVPAGFTWRTKDNVDVPVGLPELTALARVLIQHGFAQHLKARSLKDNDVKNALTIADLDKILWPTK